MDMECECRMCEHSDMTGKMQGSFVLHTYFKKAFKTIFKRKMLSKKFLSRVLSTPFITSFVSEGLTCHLAW